jgi:acetyltransferase-like isoleucine patch superfamily enzyme
MTEIRPPTLYEKLLRKFSIITQIVSLMPIYTLFIGLIALSLAPAIWFYQQADSWSADVTGLKRAAILGFAVGIGYLIYGFTLLFIAPAANFVLRANLKAWRGQYFSGAAVRWYIHNGLTYIVRYTFLEFITPTPMCILFYKMMGMKLGRGVQINSTNISDPSLIEMGDKVTIGGSATIVGHYGQHGYLVLAPVKIGKGATIGLRAIIMGGAEIGEGAKIMANSVVLPKMRIPAGETWAGIPAQRIDTKQIDFGDSPLSGPAATATHAAGE